MVLEYKPSRFPFVRFVRFDRVLTGVWAELGTYSGVSASVGPDGKEWGRIQSITESVGRSPTIG